MASDHKQLWFPTAVNMLSVTSTMLWPAAKVYFCLTTLSYMVTIFEGFMHAEIINLKIGNDKALRLIMSCLCIIEKQYYH